MIRYYQNYQERAQEEIDTLLHYIQSQDPGKGGAVGEDHGQLVLG